MGVLVIRKWFAILSTLLVILCSITSGCLFDQPPRYEITENEESYSIYYEWWYQWRKWTYIDEVLKETYQSFAGMERERFDYTTYITNTADDAWIMQLAETFSQMVAGAGWAEDKTVPLMLSFVQSIPYTVDLETKGEEEYPRYSIETIVDGGGDCEDTSILFASLVRALGYSVALLYFEEDRHMAVGLEITQATIDNWQEGYDLTYYEAENGTFYAFCETTSTGWGIGQKPDELKGESVKVLVIAPL